MNVRVLVTFAVATLAATVSCKPHDPGADSTNSSGDGDTVVRTKSGEETHVHLGAGSIPPEFPPGMALYPGSDFTSTARTARDVVLSLSTSDTVAAVFAFYRKQGYEELSDLQVEDHEVLHLKDRASGKDFQVVVKPSGSRTGVALVAPL